MDVLTVHEHGVSFHLCFLPSAFCSFKSFAPFVKFIPKYFILFDAVVTVLNFGEVNLPISVFPCTFGVTSKKALPYPGSQRFIPIFSSKTSIALALMYRCLIHLELILYVL